LAASAAVLLLLPLPPFALSPFALPPWPPLLLSVLTVPALLLARQ
jgi:hypothetical protein